VRTHTALKKHGIPCAELHERSAASHVEFSCQNSPTHYVRNVVAQSAIIDIGTMWNFEVMDEHFKFYSICTATTTSLSFMHSWCQAVWLGVVTFWVSDCVVGCVVTFWISGCVVGWCYILGFRLRGWVCCCYILGVRLRG
jgi:hypothetical protein